jgi:glutathione S-transferase
MKLELVSFKICPFVQRAVLTLLHKGIAYDVTYIDLASPPDWFKEISPFGKVPVLKVDDQHVLFESAVIDEFLDEISPGALLPREPLRRAIDRSWIDFGSSLVLDFSALIHSADADSYEKKLEQVKSQFTWLERRLGDGPYFNGESFSLVDISFAPLFMRTSLLNMQNELYPGDQYPKVVAWSGKLLELPELGNSVVDDFNALFTGHIKSKAPYVATRLGL